MTLRACKKCGSTNIKLWNCGYSSFNPGGGECKDCGAQAKGETGCLPTQEHLAKIWNDAQQPTEAEEDADRLKFLAGWGYADTWGPWLCNRTAAGQPFHDTVDMAEDTRQGEGLHILAAFRRCIDSHRAASKAGRHGPNDEREIWHYRRADPVDGMLRVSCGADYPDMHCTSVFANVTCQHCKAG